MIQSLIFIAFGLEAGAYKLIALAFLYDAGRCVETEGCADASYPAP